MEQTLQSKLTTWYNDHIVAEWYKSAALIGGWLTSLIVFAPDILQFAVDHADIFGTWLVPNMDASTKTLILAVYVTFIAPPLRAWQQRNMQAAQEKQKVTKIVEQIEAARDANATVDDRGA